MVTPSSSFRLPLMDRSSPALLLLRPRNRWPCMCLPLRRLVRPCIFGARFCCRLWASAAGENGANTTQGSLACFPVFVSLFSPTSSAALLEQPSLLPSTIAIQGCGSRGFSRSAVFGPFSFSSPPLLDSERRRPGRQAVVVYEYRLPPRRVLCYRPSPPLQSFFFFYSYLFICFRCHGH